MIRAQYRSDQSEINQSLNLDYVLKIAAAAYFNEIAMSGFAVGFDL